MFLIKHYSHFVELFFSGAEMDNSAHLFPLALAINLDTLGRIMNLHRFPLSIPLCLSLLD